MECGQGTRKHLCPCGTDKEQDRWGTGCDGVSTCQTHVKGGAGDPRRGGLQAIPYVHSRMGGSCIHFLPPKKYMYIYMYGDI